MAAGRRNEAVHRKAVRKGSGRMSDRNAERAREINGSARQSKEMEEKWRESES